MEQYNKIVLETHEESTDKAKYFTKITAKDREKVRKWLTKHERGFLWATRFLTIVRNAVEEVNYDYWIANIEPSIKNGKIYYAEGQRPSRRSCNRFAKMAKEYAPERGSRLSKLSELFLWYALRIANGQWTLESVVLCSSSVGNYWDSPNSTRNLEKTGARECGGYCDGQGNTIKIVTIGEDYELVGGGFTNYSYSSPVAGEYLVNNPDVCRIFGCGVVVLTEEPLAAE